MAKNNKYKRVKQQWYRVPVSDFKKYYYNDTYTYKGTKGNSGKSIYDRQIKRGAKYILMERVRPDHKGNYELVDDWIWVDANGKQLDQNLSKELEQQYNKPTQQKSPTPQPEPPEDDEEDYFLGAAMAQALKAKQDEERRRRNERELALDQSLNPNGAEFNYDQPAVTNYISNQIANMQDPIDPVRQEEYRKQKQKEFISWIPFAGDAVDIYDISKDVYDGNYGQAVLGGIGLFLPEVFNKGLKYAKKRFKPALEYLASEWDNYKYDLNHAGDTWNTIKKGEYQPFMSSQKKKRLKQEYYNDAQDAISQVPKLVDLNAAIPSRYTLRDVDRVYDPNREVVKGVDGEWHLVDVDYDTPELQIVSSFNDPTILGLYQNGLRRVQLPLFHRHRLVPAKTNRGNAFHEGMHDFIQNWSPTLNNFTDKYGQFSGVNMNNSDAASIFYPLAYTHEAGSWYGKPEEFMCEIANIKGLNNMHGPLSTQQKEEIIPFLSNRFSLMPEETRRILNDLSKFGFKNGGKLVKRF